MLAMPGFPEPTSCARFPVSFLATSSAVRKQPQKYPANKQNARSIGLLLQAKDGFFALSIFFFRTFIRGLSGHIPTRSRAPLVDSASGFDALPLLFPAKKSKQAI